MSDKSKSQLLEEIKELERLLKKRDRAAAARQERSAASAMPARPGRRVRAAKHEAPPAAAVPSLWTLLLEVSSDLLMELDTQGKILAISSSCVELLDSSRAKCMKKCWLHRIHPDDRKRVTTYYQNLDALSSALSPINYRILLPKGGERMVECFFRKNPDKKKGGCDTYAVVRMKTTSGMDDSGGGRAAFVHEMSQPISALVTTSRGLVRLLEAGAMEPRDFREGLEMLARQAEHAAGLVTRLRGGLVSSELERSLQPFERLIQDSLILLDREIRARQVVVHLDVPPDPLLVPADATAIRQVLINLFRNALEAMNDTPPAERRLSIAVRQSDDEMTIAVSDRGVGISVDVIDRLFQPFQSTKPHGMGVGLALSRSIIQRHGGRLWVKPNPDRGCTFYFTLPLSLKET